MTASDATQVPEQDFIVSWEIPLAWFSISVGARWDFPLMLKLVHALKEKGYASQLRAGTCLGMLILSRSREHGLRREQHYVKILPDPLGSGRVRVVYCSGGYPFSENKVEVVLKDEPAEVTPNLEGILRRLLEQPIT